MTSLQLVPPCLFISTRPWENKLLLKILIVKKIPFFSKREKENEKGKEEGESCDFSVSIPLHYFVIYLSASLTLSHEDINMKSPPLRNKQTLNCTSSPPQYPSSNCFSEYHSPRRAMGLGIFCCTRNCNNVTIANVGKPPIDEAAAKCEVHLYQPLALFLNYTLSRDSAVPAAEFGWVESPFSTASTVRCAAGAGSP
jgi:hypothetical protein